MRYESGLDRCDVKQYFLRQYFVLSIIAFILILIPYFRYSPSLIINKIESVVIIFLVFVIPTFVVSYTIFLNSIFTGVKSVFLRHQVSDYNVEVYDKKITIEYSYNTTEGLITVKNLIDLNDIITIETNIHYKKEFNVFQRWEIFFGYHLSNLPPGVVFNPLIDKRKILKILLIRNYQMKNYMRKSGIFGRAPRTYFTKSVYIEMNPDETDMFMSDVRRAIRSMNRLKVEIQKQ